MSQDHDRPLIVAVVDDDPAVRDSLATVFQMEGFHVWTYGTGDEFLAVAKTVTPDCLLLDVHMPVRSGLDILEAVGGADYAAPIIMISGQGDIPMAVLAIKAGAHDFIEKPFDADAVIERVRATVTAYRHRHERRQQQASARRFAHADTLTAREAEVLDQITKGLSNKEAGRILGISPRTVEVHRARIMEKVGARNTADLMRIVLSDDH
jgi:two-component system, LuxR family, response regulator FixJ